MAEWVPWEGDRILEDADDQAGERRANTVFFFTEVIRDRTDGIALFGLLEDAIFVTLIASSLAAS